MPVGVDRIGLVMCKLDIPKDLGDFPGILGQKDSWHCFCFREWQPKGGMA
jgi:hypothetical protein